MDEAFNSRILGKYQARYFICGKCGLLQVENPFWLEEAYASPIAEADTGLVKRNIQISTKLVAILYALFGVKGKYLDFAGGYGLLTRIMRDRGFDYFWCDKYCENIIARGFEASTEGAPFSAVTAFEALEHVVNPVGFIEEAFNYAKCKTIIFSTQLFEGRPPPPSWWYYAFETGQHISFFQHKTLYTIANKLHLNFYTSKGMHIITDKKISSIIYHLLAMRPYNNLISLVARQTMTPRTMDDHLAIMGRFR